MSSTSEPQLKPLTDTTIANVIAVTEDPIDAMRLAADLYAMNAYVAERRRAAAAGKAAPPLPTPISKYMQVFMAELRDRLRIIGALLDSDELARLWLLGAAFSARMDRGEADLGEEVFALLSKPPAEVVAWLRANLDELETRVASGGLPS